MSPSDRKKPVKLQVNNSGSWKNVVGFDAADEFACGQVMDAAATLGEVAGGRVTFRVVIDDALSQLLYHWSKEHGWQERLHG